MKSFRYNPYDMSRKWKKIETITYHPIISAEGNFVYRRHELYINHMDFVIEMQYVKFIQQQFQDVTTIHNIDRVFQLC